MSNYISKDEQAKQAEKQKTVLTNEVIYNSLIFSYKFNLFGWLVVSALALIVGIALIFAFSIDSPFDEKWTKIAKILSILIPFVIAIVDIAVYFYNRKRVNIDDYKIITDRVERVSENDRHIRRYSYEHAMYLWHCGHVVISYDDTQRISKGDIYYVLVSKEHPDKAVLIFDAQKCELAETGEETNNS